MALAGHPLAAAALADRAGSVDAPEPLLRYTFGGAALAGATLGGREPATLPALTGSRYAYAGHAFAGATLGGRPRDDITNATITVTTPALELPALTGQGTGHRFDAYQTPSLSIALDCALYVPRPLDCQVWIDYWQPPCFSVQIGTITAAAPLPPLPPLAAPAAAEHVQPATISAAAPIPALTLTATGGGQQIIDLPDADAGHAGLPHGTRPPDAALGLPLHHRPGYRGAIRQTAHQHQSQPISTPRWMRWADMLRFRTRGTADHQHGARIRSGAELPAAESLRTRADTRPRHAEAIRLRRGDALPWAETIRTHHRRRIDEQPAQQTATGRSVGHRPGLRLGLRLRADWSDGTVPAPGYWWPWYTPPSIDLVLYCDTAYTPPEIDTGDAPAPTTSQRITAGRILIVIHTLEIYRTADGAPIDASDFSIAIDMDSWAWGWSATLLTDTAYARVAPDSNGPQDLTIVLDGQQFRLLAEELSEDRTGIGKPARRVSGRGIAAVLSSPYAPARSRAEEFTRTAQQLAGDELENTGWSLKWEIEDWLVPGDIYSYAARAPVQSITDIAQAAGAFVLPDPKEKILHVRSRYPTSPWDWDSATPDYVIDANPIKSIAARWTERPAYNKCWVAGKHGGVIVDTTRAGTAGDRVAPQVVHPLITDSVVGRERGRVEISAGGKWQEVSLTIPYLDGDHGPGLILPGSLVQVNDPRGAWRGIVQGTDVKATLTAADQILQIDRRVA